MTTEERLQGVFETVFDRQIVLTDDLKAEQIPEWDSMAHINLMFGIEQEFGIQFPGNRLAEFRTVGELKRYLESHGAA
jgi:acyl carrier protein